MNHWPSIIAEMSKRLNMPHDAQTWREFTLLLLGLALSSRPGTLVLNTPAICSLTQLAFIS